MMALIGAIVSVAALFMETTITTSVPSSYSYGTNTATVHNLGLLQNQAFVFEAGLALAVAGFALLAGGLVVDALKGFSSGNDTQSFQPALSAEPANVEAGEPAEVVEARRAKRAREDAVLYWVAGGVFAFVVLLVLLRM